MHTFIAFYAYFIQHALLLLLHLRPLPPGYVDVLVLTHRTLWPLLRDADRFTLNMQPLINCDSPSDFFGE